MGKSPGKWIKTVLFGKKSSKSNLSKDSVLDKKTPITVKSHSKDIDTDSMVISSPVRHVVNASGGHTQLEKSSSANLMHDTIENIRNTINAANNDELIRLQKAATKAQAAFRGYLARRAFWALKGIIRLQALARGHLVRRQAIATLACMRAIVDFQALVRGQRVRLSINGPNNLQKRAPGDHVHKERANLLQTSLKSEKLSKNAFGVKLVTSSKTTTPLNIQYKPDEANSVINWLERWSSSNFWDPVPQLKKTRDTKPKGKHTKSQSQETEITKTKRSIRKVPSPSLDKVNQSLRKISLSAASGSDKSTVEKVDDLNVMVAEPVDVNPPLVENETNDKENHKTRRRKSLPAKQECSTVPSYMAATESAKAKLRAQAAEKAAEDGGDNGYVRRHSLPSSTGKLSLQSPRVQKLLHANGKTNNEKVVSAGWRR